MKCLIKEKLSEHKYRDNNGYLICVDSVLARTGKQRYLRSEIFADAADDDSEIEVDRKPEEVFSEKTLASFENCPLCVEHPDEDVNPDNYKDYAVGFVRDVHKGNVDGQDVILGTLVITDGKTIEEVENGQHTDLSCGYDCDIEDSVNPQQRNIRGNHVALCEQGRAGNARIVDSKKVKDSERYIIYRNSGAGEMIYEGSDLKDVIEEIKSLGRNYYIIDTKDGYKKITYSEAIKMKLDSVKDEDIFKVDVSSAEDRDVSRFITEAQNVGFITDDTGYIIYLKHGNRDMLNQLKARTHTINIKFFDSYNGYYDEKEKDNWNNGYAYYFEDDDDYYRALKQVKASGQKILATGVEAGPNGRQYFVLKDSCKDNTYTIQQHNGKWYYEIKEDDGFTHLVGPYTSMEEAIMYFKKHRPNETLTDEESTAEKVTKNLEKNFENFKETRMKDDSDLSLLREYFKEKQPSRKMELRNKLRSMGYKEGISGVNSSSRLWVELNGKKYEVKNLSSVTPLDSIKDSTFVIRYKDIKDEKIITITLEGKTYKAIYNGMSSRYPDMADVYIPELAVLNSKYTPADDLGNHPKDGKYYIRKERIKDANPDVDNFIKSLDNWTAIKDAGITSNDIKVGAKFYHLNTNMRFEILKVISESASKVYCVKYIYIFNHNNSTYEFFRSENEDWYASGGRTASEVCANDLYKYNYTSIKPNVAIKDSAIKDEYPKLNSRQEQELRKYAQRFSYEMEEVYDGLNSRVNREGMSVDKAVEDLKETMVAQKSLYDSSIKDSNTVRDSIREGETYTNKNGVQLKILGINTDVTGKKYVTYRIKNDTYNHPIENVENMLKANHYTKDSAIRDSYVVLRKDEAFEESGAKSVARKYNLQVKMDGYKNIFSGKEEDIIRMLYDYFKPQYAGQIELRIKDSSIKDSYIYADLGQDYHKNADDIRKKGLKVSYTGRSNGFGMYGKIEGTRKQLERLQELGYFENEIIHDAGIKDSVFTFNYKDLYHNESHKEDIKANTVEEAIEELKKRVALRGIGTANVWVVSISSETETYPRGYGKLNSLTVDSGKLKDSCKKDSLVNIIKVAKVVKKYGK